MTIYYTAKDIEELAAKGLQQLEVGPGITLTDFARETARQLNITLVDVSKRAETSTPAPSASRPTGSNDKYNKPSGCMHAASTPSARNSQATLPPAQPSENVDPNTVTKLIDLVGKAIKRGG